MDSLERLVYLATSNDLRLAAGDAPLVGVQTPAGALACWLCVILKEMCALFCLLPQRKA
jgi:hypothetical protein